MKLKLLRYYRGINKILKWLYAAEMYVLFETAIVKNIINFAKAYCLD